MPHMSILESFLETPINRLENIESNFGEIKGKIDPWEISRDSYVTLHERAAGHRN